ncbi:MAG TPA: ABC transporter permease [Solirubrobacteraceae bacterium]|jgi:peptide/nickel transport system permease protein|nr:ABC transporter permease [Solirubrobacteraceae bacterium]
MAGAPPTPVPTSPNRSFPAISWSPRFPIGRRRAAVGAGLGTASARRALIPLGIVTLVMLILPPVLATHSALDITTAGPFHHPSLRYPFGTDDLGRDIFSRVLYGARASWLAALGVIVVGAAFGGLVGALAGAFGGIVDTLLMRLTDLFLALPAPVLAIAVIASVGPSLLHTLLALSIVWWPWYARIVRGEVRALAARPHAEAARLAGVGRARLVLRHLLPGAVAPVIVAMSLDVGNLILALAALSFIGLGAPPPAAELGAMSSQGLEYLFGYAWVPLAPAVGVAVLALVANLLGEKANRSLDERTAR